MKKVEREMTKFEKMLYDFTHYAPYIAMIIYGVYSRVILWCYLGFLFAMKTSVFGNIYPKVTDYIYEKEDIDYE